MGIAEYVVETLTDVERHLKLLTAAARPEELVGAASNYLASWARSRIANLQKIDGGWGPFDRRQRPESIRGVADIILKSNALRSHCLALKNAGIDPTPELLELDLYFSIAKRAAEDLITAKPHHFPASPRSLGYRHWSDRDSLAA